MKKDVVHCFAITALLWASVALSQQTPALSHRARITWPEQSRETRPWTYWWWMGSAVDKTNLTRELQRYHDVGLGGVHIIPIYGAKGWEDQYIDYLSPKWMEMLRHTVTEAERLGLGVDMTTGTGWCFGPSASDEDANATVVVKTFDLGISDRLAQKLDRKSTQALIAIGPDGKSIDLMDSISRHGTSRSSVPEPAAFSAPSPAGTPQKWRLSDLTGVSGLKVVQAIIEGERDPARLLALCDEQIQRKKAGTVKESLRGCWKAEHVFALRQALELWETFQKKIADCDRELEKLLHQLAGPAVSDDNPEGTPLKLGPAKDPGKNAPAIEHMQQLLARICGGRDATQIPGLSTYLVMQLVSEVGTDMKRWPTEKHFVSWLGLGGGRRQSGKRKASVKAHRNRAGRMFCRAAGALAQSVDKALGGFYRRLRGRVGGLAANVALARKLAQLFYRLLRYGMAYVEHGLKAYEAKVFETEARLLRKLAKKQGFTLVPACT